MRRVACYGAESQVLAPDDVISALTRLVPTIEGWLKGKGAESLKSGITNVTLRDGRVATIDARNYSTAGAMEWDIAVEEPTPTGQFLTRIVLGAAAGGLFLFVELRAGVGGYRVAPHDVDARCPQVLRELLSIRTWSVGKTPVSVKPLRWPGEAGAKKLLAVLDHLERNLPIVVVSEFDGRPLSALLPTELARDLCGLAIVVHIDYAASWTVTTLRGKEWSCFDGAVRVYWPMHSGLRRSFDHPYWTRTKLISATGSEQAAASGIRTELRRRLLELSTYAVDESTVLARIRDDDARQRFEEMRRVAESNGEQGALAEEYFNQCVTMSAELAKRSEQISFLQDQVRSLNQVWQFAEGDAAGLPPEPKSAVESVEQAVVRARTEFSDVLVFGEDVERSVRDVASDAGPPDKVYDHLRTLADMGKARQKDGLGRNMIEWFAANGISASYESEAVTNNKSERQRRTWSDGTNRRLFTAHLKPNDGTSPDRCVRIYFDYDERTGKVIIGWVGRHP